MRDRIVIVDILTRKFKSISYKQYDSNNELNIVVYEGKTLTDISNYVASVYFELPSGRRYEVEGTIENNTIKVMLSSSILEEYGQVDVECQLFNLDEVVTTFTFYLDVEKSINKAGALDPNTQHKHLNLDVLNQITQEMVDSIGLNGGLIDLSIYQTKTDTTLETDNKTVSGAINELNEKIGNTSGNIDLSDYALKSEIPTVPTKVSELQNDKGYLTEVPSEYITENELNAKGYLTQHQDISGKADRSEIPTKTSQLTNDRGFITSIPSEYVTETELNAKGYLTEHQDISNKANKSEIPTKVSQLTNDSNFAVQPNFTFAINMIASTEQPSVTTTGVYPNLVITFNIPQGTTSSGGDEPVVAEKAIYYGRLSIAEVGGRVVQYSAITDTMIKNGTNITKITPQTLGKTSLGKQSTTAESDYVIVAVPNNEGYVVTADDGFGGKVIFNKEVAGANGDVILTIDGNQYAIYGEILISPAEIFIYIDKN